MLRAALPCWDFPGVSQRGPDLLCHRGCGTVTVTAGRCQSSSPPQGQGQPPAGATGRCWHCPEHTVAPEHPQLRPGSAPLGREGEKGAQFSLRARAKRCKPPRRPRGWQREKEKLGKEGFGRALAAPGTAMDLPSCQRRGGTKQSPRGHPRGDTWMGTRDRTIRHPNKELRRNQSAEREGPRCHTPGCEGLQMAPRFSAIKNLI